ncbi:hypothetical protein F7R14_16005 [Pseudomonas lini]|uniref:Uncharacterized protein n=1 Tax=Pseudomonas lini TaxID=163011 RepID=A0A7V7P2V1_9PSED|nr:hypothetical protein F7R14_16005 [Pseudomonas lini]MDT9678697.1 hypothetical protein [Pseudomonas sp. JV414]
MGRPIQRWTQIAVHLCRVGQDKCQSVSAIHVGAGLLAKAVCQATLMLADTPSSRASPLPQVLRLS